MRLAIDRTCPEWRPKVASLHVRITALRSISIVNHPKADYDDIVWLVDHLAHRKNCEEIIEILVAMGRRNPKINDLTIDVLARFRRHRLETQQREIQQLLESVLNGNQQQAKTILSRRAQRGNA